MANRDIEVLVVDDDFAVAELHRIYVEDLTGFRVIAVTQTGAQTLDAVDQYKPDLILLDVHLPDMSGIEVLRQLRARPHGAAVDVLAITAAREVDTIRAAMAGGVVDYLIKPFTLRVFGERLRNYASRHETLQRLSARKATVQDQHQVDRLLTARPRRSEDRELPKGLSRHTLELVADALRESGGDLSANEAAERCGLSRVSTRRYLEQLVAMGLAELRPRYGSAGRPEHGYSWTNGNPG